MQLMNIVGWVKAQPWRYETISTRSLACFRNLNLLQIYLFEVANMSWPHQATSNQ